MSASSIGRMIQEQIGERLGVPADSVRIEERFRRLGVDSLMATSLLTALGARLGRALSSTLAWEYPTPEALARHLAGETAIAPAPRTMPRGTDPDEPIAIVGLACRLPGAPDANAYWRLLRGGVDAIREAPSDRWDVDELFDADVGAPGKVTTRWGGFLDDIATFDAAFFGVSPREAKQMDPQQRLMLELSWEALEDAGAAPASLRDTRTGVFFGAMWTDYARLEAASVDQIAQHTATGQDLSIIPARVSYTLGLLGPSIAVNTACSSSLVAVHLARQSLLRGESRVALAGGVNLMIGPASTITMSKFGAMAPDGRSKAFDARANGYVRGEGGGVVVLKRLSTAIADGDQVYALLRGSAVNNDGFSNGLTAPSPKAQEGVLRDACADAGVDPGAVQYVEAHGTGTMLGDPIEAGALGAVLGAGRAPDRPLRIGSVKTNIGHLEAAAGIAGLIKVALAMRHGELPPTLHYQNPNPHIPFEALRLRVQSQLEPWEAVDGKRVAGVSSFGFGGTNAHVVLEAAVAAGAVVPPRPSASAWVRDRPAARPTKAIAVFGGQGSQWAGMGRSLLAGDPVGRAALHRCDRVMRPLTGWSLIERLQRGDPAAFEDTAFVQPAIFAMQVAIARALEARGVRFDAVVGQSMGEVAAAHVAGALSLADAARVICVRSAIVGGARGGRMAVVPASLDATADAIAPYAGRMAIAVAAGPESTVVAGEAGAIAELTTALEARGLAVRAVRVDYASHSAFMDPLLPELRAALSSIRPRVGGATYWSTVTGGPLAGSALDADYWARNLREPVLFAPTLARLLGESEAVFVEVDPHPVLETFIAQCLEHAGRPGRVVACGARGETETSTLTDAVEQLAQSGLLRAPSSAPGAHRAELVVLYARTSEALRASAARLREHVEQHPDEALGDLAYTLLEARSPMDHAAALVAPTRDALVEALSEVAKEPDAPAPLRVVSAPRIVFVFSGQGSQWLGMGRELFAEEPVFRDALVACDRAIAREAGWSVTAEMHATVEASRLEDIDVLQPMLFAFQVSLAALWRSWGVEPCALVGHSMGEIAAACVAGALSIDDGATIMVRRSALLTRLRGRGEMAVVGLSVDEATREVADFEGRLGVAVSNSRRSTVLSGEPSALAEVLARLEGRGVFARRIKADVAGHSPQIDPLLEELGRALAGVTPRVASLPMRSTVTGGELTGPEMTASYWTRNLRAPVRFADAVEALWNDGATVFLEVSPHPVLTSAIDEVRQALNADGLAIGSLRRDQAERHTLLETLAALHLRGQPLDVLTLFPETARRLRLPAYPWQRERHWLDAPAPPAPAAVREHRAPHPQDAWMKSLRWVPAPLASMAAPRVGRWWIVGDGDGLAGSLAAALEAAGDAVVCQRCDEPTVEATRAKLAAAFEGRPPTGIVHLRATDPAGDGDHVEAGLARGCDSVLQLVNAISAMGWRDAPRLHLVTRGAQAVDPGLSTGPARDVDFMQSALLGLARVIATEHPELRPLRIDLDPIRPDDGSAALHAELLAGDDEDEVAWRAGKRSAARLVRTPAPTGGLERRRERAVSVRRDGSYLVTGGLGGLGLHAADWLSRKGAGAVVLVGRSGATTAEQRGALARIEARGTVVVVAAADAVDRASMARLLEAIPSDRPLRGVIHVAGVLDDGVLGDLTAERMRVTFAPKARGAVNLHALTRGMELDFFVLYGSVAGVLGMPAQGNYAAANACLDGLAHHRRALGLPATSIDWGLFGEVGLATAQANRGRRLEARGMRAMTPVEGMAALERVLERDLTQVLVLPIDMRRWSALMPAGSRMLAPLLEDAPAESPRAATTRVPEVARVTAGTPLEAMTELVRADVARVLSLGRLGAVPPGKPLRELGLDSLMAVELRNALGRRVGIPLPSTLTIDHPTPLAIARYMLSVAPAPPPVEAPTAHRVMAPLRFEVPLPVAPREDTIESIPMGERWFADSFRVIPAPGGYAQRAVDVSAAMRAVQALNEAGVGATLTHVMIRAAALALARNPELHQLVCGYRKLTPGQVDIGLSMAGKTTYAPVVVLAAADGVSLGDMVARVEEATVRGRAKETLDLATLRRVGWMTPVGFLRRLSVRVMQEMFWYRRKLVGTFQVTCVPTVDATVPLQFYSGSILSFGRPRDAVVPIDGRPSIRPMLTLTVCVDHVAMDGMRAATLVNAIAAIVDSEELVDEARQGVTRAVTARETCRAQGRVAALQPLASGT